LARAVLRVGGGGGLGDVDRAADRECASGRHGGQFRKGHSYRHGLSLGFSGSRLTRPKWKARLTPFQPRTALIACAAIELTMNRCPGVGFPGAERAANPVCPIVGPNGAQDVTETRGFSRVFVLPTRYFTPPESSKRPPCGPAGGLIPRCFQPPS